MSINRHCRRQPADCERWLYGIRISLGTPSTSALLLAVCADMLLAHIRSTSIRNIYYMLKRKRVLTKENVDDELRQFAVAVEEVGASVQGIKGRALLESLKRVKVNVGPYPDVTLFEAANRIMTDLVIYNGVKWLLDNEIFPFASYTVEFGNEDGNGFDLRADSDCACLVGEAFNVAPSFFQGKKSLMLKKLQKDGASATYHVIMVNHDAVASGYKPKAEPGVYYVFVNVGTASAAVVPEITPGGVVESTRRGLKPRVRRLRRDA